MRMLLILIIDMDAVKSKQDDPFKNFLQFAKHPSNTSDRY